MLACAQNIIFINIHIFQNSLQLLMDRLQKAEPHFIRLVHTHYYNSKGIRRPCLLIRLSVSDG